MLMGLMSIQEQKDRSPRWPVAGGPAQLVVTDLKSDRASFGAYEYHIMTSCNYSISWVLPPPSNSDHQDYYIFNTESL